MKIKRALTSRVTLLILMSGLAFSKGAIKDNSGHPYDVSYSREVSSLDFTSALAQVKNDAENKRYAVKSYNCTDAALLWMNADRPLRQSSRSRDVKLPRLESPAIGIGNACASHAWIIWPDRPMTATIKAFSENPAS